MVVKETGADVDICRPRKCSVLSFRSIRRMVVLPLTCFLLGSVVAGCSRHDIEVEEAKLLFSKYEIQLNQLAQAMLAIPELSAVGLGEARILGDKRKSNDLRIRFRGDNFGHKFSLNITDMGKEFSNLDLGETASDKESSRKFHEFVNSSKIDLSKLRKVIRLMDNIETFHIDVVPSQRYVTINISRKFVFFYVNKLDDPFLPPNRKTNAVQLDERWYFERIKRSSGFLLPWL